MLGELAFGTGTGGGVSAVKPPLAGCDCVACQSSTSLSSTLRPSSASSAFGSSSSSSSSLSSASMRASLSGFGVRPRRMSSAVPRCCCDPPPPLLSLPASRFVALLPLPVSCTVSASLSDDDDSSGTSKANVWMASVPSALRGVVWRGLESSAPVPQLPRTVVCFGDPVFGAPKE